MLKVCVCGELLLTEHDSGCSFRALRACGLRNLCPSCRALGALVVADCRGPACAWASSCPQSPVCAQATASGLSVLGGAPRWTWASRVCYVLGHLFERALDWRRLIRARFAAAAATKSLQSCPTLCDPIEGSPPGSPVPGILQARALEWVAISFSGA